MKWNIASIIIFLITLFSFTTPIHAAAELYTLDPMHTYVFYRISHLGFSEQTGKWFAEGTLLLDKDKPQDSKLNVTIPLGNIVTGIPELDKHLKSSLFFNISQFPAATFVSDKIDVTGKNTAKVHGTLNLHGVSKPMTLNVKLNKVGINDITGKMTVGFSATSQLKRSDFGINTLIPSVGNEVTLDIQAEAYKGK